METHAQTTNPDDYSLLTDTELRSAIRYTESRIIALEEDHASLMQTYRCEVTRMRRSLVDRALSRVVAPLSAILPEQQARLERVFRDWGADAHDVAKVLRLVTNGRTDETHELTQAEATELLALVGEDR